MSKENCKNVSSCKQSFKAAENFLRRVAFNLGNTQSKTEVKIISCIPIDVTDLQQRIFQLQNELADIKQREPPKTCITCAKRSQISPKQILCNKCLLSTTSILSVFCPGGAPSAQLRQRSSLEPIASQGCIESVPKKEEVTKYKSFFAKKKGYKKKVKNRLVYRAQTDTNTPFNNKFRRTGDRIPMKSKEEHKGENRNQSYLADVIKRQYRHQPLANEYSNASDISSPICRDHAPACSPNSPYFESDACSCFHDQFQNIDKYMKNNANKYPTPEPVRKLNRDAYYDAKFYDLVPVKEKQNNRNDIANNKRVEPTKHIMKCWPGKARPKHSHKHALPTVVNYCTVSPLRDECKRLRVNSPNDKHVVMNRMAAKRFIASTPRRPTELELGPVYAKRVREHKKQNILPIITQKQDVATGSPTGDDVAGGHTATTAATITDPPEDKTETTLNQIKNMLQSVLTEVKTNSKAGSSSVQPKKDAVVQNGPPRGYEYGASQLLQSYTYSPYNISPFIPSCSHPISCSNYVYPEFPGGQGMPFQQYPLLIQPQKHMCNNYYRNTNFTKPVTKHATSAGTNTEKVQERNKETAQLIKEIYKSMALSMEESSKDNSFREYTKPKATAKKNVDVGKMESDKESKSIAQAISEIFRNTRPQDSTMTGTTDTTLNSYLNPNKPKTVTTRAVKKDNKTERNYSQNKHSAKNQREQEKERMSTYHETEEQSEPSNDTAVDEDTTEETSTETEIADVVEVKEPVKPTDAKKEKSGIFKKMLKMFQAKRRRRRNDAGNDNENESESDSDDYQTVYSHKFLDATPKQKKVQAVRSRPHSKVVYSKLPQKRSRTRSPEINARTKPCMEQEYRRYWDEKLMFHEHQRQRYSSATPRQAADKGQRNNYAYYQKYEARPVLIDPIRQVPLRMPGNVVKPRYTSNNYYTRSRENYNDSRPNDPRYNNYESNVNNVRNNTHVGATGPHFVTSKSNGNRKGMFSKKWLKKCKPQCAQQWKELIING